MRDHHIPHSCNATIDLTSIILLYTCAYFLPPKRLFSSSPLCHPQAPIPPLCDHAVPLLPPSSHTLLPTCPCQITAIDSQYTKWTDNRTQSSQPNRSKWVPRNPLRTTTYKLPSFRASRTLWPLKFLQSFDGSESCASLSVQFISNITPSFVSWLTFPFLGTVSSPFARYTTNIHLAGCLSMREREKRCTNW